LELIIKPTEICNFACTFCSSTNISESKKNLLDLDYVFRFLKKYPHTNTIIINGGDPLVISPQYYQKIIDFLDSENLKTSLSFTTNLWDFYLNPNKWISIFKNPRVGVTTSFNFGSSRRINRDRIFTVDLFWKISDLFLDKIGYRPDFISVITEENEETAIDNVRLAREMGVECKLNYAMSSGAQGRPYQLSKIYKMYLEIYDQGLTNWEFNTKQLVKRFSGKNTVCPQNRKCDENIRCLQPDGDYYSCGAFGDDKEFAIDFDAELDSKNVFTPLSNVYELSSLKDECYTCPMFTVCNGCKKTIKDMKAHNMVEDHCSLMKSQSVKLLEVMNVQ
jgi:radical SAM protein with 4Fe4S-binding SPASM domain